MKRTNPEMLRRARTWPRTSRGGLICPDCGKIGAVPGSWLNAHLFHEDCPQCGRTVTARGLKSHQAKAHRR